MSARDTLILMSCGAEKLDREERLYDFYLGPMWQTLRLHIGAIPRVNVCVLSAGFGFANVMMYARPYDERMSAAKADYLIERGVFHRNDRFGAIKPIKGATGPSPFVEAGGGRSRPYDTVLIAGAGHYRRVMESFVAGFREHKLVAMDAVVNVVEGGIGCQRSQLGSWLRLANTPPTTSVTRRDGALS